MAFVPRGHKAFNTGRKIWSYLILLTATRSMSSAMKAVVLDKFGGPENMRIGDVGMPEVKDDHVLIKVHATAVNRADVLQRMGKYPPPKGESETLGLEASGVVEFLGANVKKKFKIGEKVMALLAGGGYAEYVSVPDSLVMKVPSGTSLVEAAAIPEVWLTAYQLLHFIGRVQKDDNVLIHAGGSGVGTAAIQMTSLAGAKAFVTAGSSSKLEFAKKLGAYHTANYKEDDFYEVFKKETEGKGINLILDPVGASFWQKNVKSIGLDGRWVLYGLLGGSNIDGNLFGQMLSKRVQITATTLRSRPLKYKKDLVDAFSENVLPHFATGELKPIIDSVFELKDISEAHKTMETAANTGKIVIKVLNEKEEL